MLEDQIKCLAPEDYLEYKALLTRWEEISHKRLKETAGDDSLRNNAVTLMDLTPAWHLRFLRCHCLRDGSFSSERALAEERKLQRHFLTLNVFELQAQLQTKTLFPVPGLKSFHGHDMFYMKPSRFQPKENSTSDIIDNLVYVMNCMLENNEKAQKNGIGLVYNMDDWTMEHYQKSYIHRFMMALQSYIVPVKIVSFLIVNPPSWFRTVWLVLKPMLSPSFRQCVKICPESKLSKYLSADFRQFLPDEMTLGRASTNGMLHKFIAERQAIETKWPAMRYCGGNTRFEQHWSDFGDGTLGDLADAGYFFATTGLLSSPLKSFGGTSIGKTSTHSTTTLSVASSHSSGSHCTEQTNQATASNGTVMISPQARRSRRGSCGYNLPPQTPQRGSSGRGRRSSMGEEKHSHAPNVPITPTVRRRNGAGRAPTTPCTPSSEVTSSSNTTPNTRPGLGSKQGSMLWNHGRDLDWAMGDLIDFESGEPYRFDDGDDDDDDDDDVSIHADIDEPVAAGEVTAVDILEKAIENNDSRTSPDDEEDNDNDLESLPEDDTIIDTIVPERGEERWS